MQDDTLFFSFEVVFSFYLLLSLAIMAEKYLMPSLLNISNRYGLNRDVTGLLFAFGALLPELGITILAF